MIGDQLDKTERPLQRDKSEKKKVAEDNGRNGVNQQKAGERRDCRPSATGGEGEGGGRKAESRTRTKKKKIALVGKRWECDGDREFDVFGGLSSSRRQEEVIEEVCVRECVCVVHKSK